MVPELLIVLVLLQIMAHNLRITLLSDMHLKLHCFNEFDINSRY